MVLRPYQYYAVEAIIDRVKNSDKNGYIWHTTGSGKTLTSFKASQILTKLPQHPQSRFRRRPQRPRLPDHEGIQQLFRRQHRRHRQHTALVKQFSDDTKLIVTTIQKLNNAISKLGISDKMELLKDKKMVFIFDECHRSQFGETHKRIKDFFNNVQMFGFTGTPIFAENAVKNDLGKRTTKDLFDDCLHKYVITDAITDENVLKFSVEYVGSYKQKETSKTNLDINVEDIDTSELLESPKNGSKKSPITSSPITTAKRTTETFTAMFCVGNIKTLIKYYDIFKAKKAAGEHHLKIATIFSYGDNEDDPDANGIIFLDDDRRTSGADGRPPTVTSHSRDKLEEFIGDYNRIFNTKFTTKDSQSFYNYYNDIARRVKNQGN